MRSSARQRAAGGRWPRRSRRRRRAPTASISRSRCTSRTYGEWTKKEGLVAGRSEQAGRQAARVGRRERSTSRRRSDADVYVYTRQTSIDYPELLRRQRGLQGRHVRLTDANPQQKDFAWTSGVKLINYTSAKGDKLQGALYLPANYEPGKKYPLLVTIYEKLSQPREHVRHAERDEHAEPQHLHEPRLRGARSGHRLHASTIRACRRCGAWCRR